MYERATNLIYVKRLEALRAPSGGPGALRTPGFSLAMNVFLCNQVNGGSINVCTSSAHRRPRSAKREDGPGFSPCTPHYMQLAEDSGKSAAVTNVF